MQHGVVGNLVNPVVEVGGGWQLSEEQQVGHLKEGAVLGKYFDRVTAILQDAAIPVDEGDIAAAGRCIHEGRIVKHQPKIIFAIPNLPEVHGAHGPVLNGKRVGAIRAIIGNGQSVLCHEGFSLVLDT